MEDLVVAIVGLGGVGVVLVLVLASYVAMKNEARGSESDGRADVPLDDLPEDRRPYYWAALMGELSAEPGLWRDPPEPPSRIP